MINTLKIYEELAQTMDDAAARRLASVLGLIYEDLQNTVTKVEFNELRGTIRELAEAQQRTEQRMGELIGAQQQTGQRMEEYARARRDGEDVVIVGESVMRLDDGAKFGQLQRKLEAVRAVEALPLVPLQVRHSPARIYWSRPANKGSWSCRALSGVEGSVNGLTLRPGCCARRFHIQIVVIQ